MPTFNQGIRTNAGYDLFGKVQSGQTAIHYTKVVFSSLDLSNKSDDDIQKMTDVNPKELIIPNPQVLYKPKTNNSDQETEIRAIGSNETLKKGFYINTYALYAADDSGNEILYGVTADNNPSWLPAYDDVRPQALTYNWDTGDKDTDDVHFTDSHDAYATYGDLQDFQNNIHGQITNATKTGTLSAPKWLDNSTDLNDVANAGVYAFWQGVKNAPNNGMLLVYNSQADDVFQVLYAAGGATYYRYKPHSQKYTQWVTRANSHDIDNLQTQITQNKQNLTNATKTGTLSAPKWLDKSTDLNDVTNAGVYAFWQGVKNAPNNGMLLVYNSQADDVFQVLYAAGGATYYRYKPFDKDFANWETMATNKNIANLQNQINDNYSNANDTARNAMNQANSYTDNKVRNIQQGTINNPTLLSGNTDLNNITTSGVYRFWTGLKNSPTNGLMIVRNNTFGQIYQILYGGNNKVYIRSQDNNSFGNWATIFNG